MGNSVKTQSKYMQQTRSAGKYLISCLSLWLATEKEEFFFIQSGRTLILKLFILTPDRKIVLLWLPLELGSWRFQSFAFILPERGIKFHWLYFFRAGQLELNLNKLPRPAKNAGKCGLQQVPGTPESRKKNIEVVSLFDLKRIYGWWPAVATDNGEQILAVRLLQEFLFRDGPVMGALS